MKNKTFWIDDFDGEAIGGFFLKNQLKEFLDKFETLGLNPVGIKLDGDNKIEIIVEKNEAYLKQYELDIKKEWEEYIKP